MEQDHYQGGDQQERFTDEQLIHYGITEALREERPIDHTTVRVIASQLHGGQRSPLYALASTGAVIDGLREELDAWRDDNETGVEVEPWLDALDEYLDSREDSPEPVEGWSVLWPTMPNREDDEPETGEEERPPFGTLACAIGRRVVSARVEAPPGDDEAEARQTLFERVNAAGVRTLGDVVTVHTSDQDDEPDTFPWVDAANWSPREIARDDYEERRLPDAELDALFADVDEQVGSVGELGWYGLVKHEGRPGGLVLIQDEQGVRHVREAPDDEALAIQWATIQAEYETFYEQRGAYELATEDAGPSESGHAPRIWVGSLADYNNGRLHGVWMDATLEPDELEAATQFMLRNGYTPGAEEWAIMDYEDFGGYRIEEYAGFHTVSRIAQGVAKHGQAYAKWVAHVGEESEELLTDERFIDHYHGEWETAEAYVEHLLSETDSYDFMRFVPESIPNYVNVDVELYARDMQSEGLLIEELDNGKVAVFWTR